MKQNESSKNMKQSEKVFVELVEEAESDALDANVAYRGIRRALQTIGITLAVLLPLALLPSKDGKSSDPPVTQTTTTTTTNFLQVQSKQGGAEVPRIESYVKLDVDVAAPATGDVGGISIIGVPAITREWHRSVFKVGDTLWALPDVAFKLTLSALPGDCVDKSKGCEASFELVAPNYLGAGGSLEEAFVVGKKNHTVNNTLVCDVENPERCTGFNAQFFPVVQPASADPDQDVGAVNACRMYYHPLTPYVLCQFLNIKHVERESDDVCLWLRRSDVPESTQQLAEPHIAMDIKWQKINLHEDAGSGRSTCTDWNRLYVE